MRNGEEEVKSLQRYIISPIQQIAKVVVGHSWDWIYLVGDLVGKEMTKRSGVHVRGSICEEKGVGGGQSSC